MSKRRRKTANNDTSEDNSVRGPNSALTQFLREQGISADSIRKRWLKSKEAESQGALESEKFKKEDEAEQELAVLPSLEDSETESDPDPNGRGGRLKRLGYSDDSDEEEYESNGKSRTVSTTPGPIDNGIDEEARLKRRKQQLQQRKRKKKRATELLDRKVRRISTLQDICINKISDNISKLQNENSTGDDSISSNIRESLGGISLENLNKLARTLSKNRALNDHTLQLFLRTQLRSLSFHDCSKISYEGYKLLAIFAPHLTQLSLQMCGQLNNESLLYIAEKLPNLKELYLDGPFLINEETWNCFFEKMKGRLQAFHVSNTHRFDDHCLGSLLRNCGSSLRSLMLSRLDAVTDYSLLPQYLTNSEFECLNLQYPHKEDYINDEVIINILSQVGGSLKKLNLNGCVGLTDATIINGISTFLPKSSGISVLESLELEELAQVTTDGLVFLFSQVQMPNLTHCSLKRCLQVGDMAITEFFLNEASGRLESLNLNSLKTLTKDSFKIMSCPLLRRLDLGFVRCIDDEAINLICLQNPSLKIIEVFGDNMVTGSAQIRSGVAVIGRQSDSI
ncbi:LAFE_0C11232g1_1 [Lachancea fermentati]|uniref:LAFE_0C11232g1_1 n=1 Tax=Lachancea fermentati TaxID=4955 RepID=A0A1G4MA56_LACFM|nr:LAFE_0C11232g1_1 [Lachancea fermentati]